MYVVSSLNFSPTYSSDIKLISSQVFLLKLENNVILHFILATYFNENCKEIYKGFQNNITSFFLKKVSGGHESFLWGYWYPCFGLLVMSPLGFKVRVESLIDTWPRRTFYTFPEIHLWCNTWQPLGGLYGSKVNLLHIPKTRHWWGSNGILITSQANDLLNELCQLG